VIVPEPQFFEMRREAVLGDAVVFHQPLPGSATEPFQAGDVNPAGGEALPVVRLQVPVTAEQEAVIAPEPIGMDHAAPVSPLRA
jgi:hypothetical protein